MSVQSRGCRLGKDAAAERLERVIGTAACEWSDDLSRQSNRQSSWNAFGRTAKAQCGRIQWSLRSDKPLQHRRSIGPESLLGEEA